MAGGRAVMLLDAAAALSIALSGLAMLAFAVCGAWLALRPAARMAVLLPSRWWLVLMATAFMAWALAWFLAGPDSFAVLVAGALRNAAMLAWLAAALLGGKGPADGAVAIKLILTTLICICLITAALVFLTMIKSAVAGDILSPELLVPSATIVEMIAASGGLLLVDNMIRQRANSVRMPVVVLAGGCVALWAYALNIHMISAVSGAPAAMLIFLEPGVALVMLPPMLMAGMDTGREKVRLSRTMAFRAVAMLGIAIYLILIAIAGAGTRLIGGDYGAVAQGLFLTIALVCGGALLVLPRARAWLSVTISKNFFEHRYDYRGEWMRFTATIARGGGGEDVEVRVARALADLTGSPGAILLTPDAQGDYAASAKWGWASAASEVMVIGRAAAAPWAVSGRIFDLDTVRSGQDAGEVAAALPAWLVADPQIWAAVPLCHFDQLVGIALLRRPPATRRLDWEDLDVMRIGGQQAASYLAEIQSQQQLSDARRFDEFNRRFAFIIHDVKNLASQLGLLAANAERHAENPAFRRDMIATLQSSVGRMNGLLERLSPSRPGAVQSPGTTAPLVLADHLAPLVATWARRHPVTLTAPDQPVAAMANPAALTQIVSHLIDNAIDASPADAAIGLEIAAEPCLGRPGASIRVTDRGCGMSAAFIAHELFKPFASTKAAGFGLGAYEALQQARALGGRIDVTSAEGQGSQFTLWLPAPADLGAAPAASPALMEKLA